MLSKSSSLKVALIQVVSSAEIAANLTMMRQQVAIAAKAGAQLIVFPEFAYQIGAEDSARRASAEDLGQGPVQEAFANLAREQQIYLLPGTLLTKSSQPNQFYNTALVYAPNGELISYYHKIHRFKFNDGNQEYDEPALIAAGEVPGVVTIEGWRLGLAICYDLRFPELFRAMGQVDAILLPSAFTAMTGAAHWHVLCRARAIENLCYMLAVNQGGNHPGGRQTYGHSLVVNPWGEIMTETTNGGDIIYVTMELSSLEHWRRKLPALDHRVL